MNRPDMNRIKHDIEIMERPAARDSIAMYNYIMELKPKAELLDAINWAIEFAKESGLRYDDIIMLSTEGWIIHSKEGVTTPLVEAYRNKEEK